MKASIDLAKGNLVPGTANTRSRCLALFSLTVASVQDGQKILANGNLYIIELDETKADPYYIKAFFESEPGISVYV